MTFAWASTKDGRVRISWRGKVVTTLAGGPAARFLGAGRGSRRAEAEQLLMARATGNFKRGNERR